jgi:hypothetical protein
MRLAASALTLSVACVALCSTLPAVAAPAAVGSGPDPSVSAGEKTFSIANDALEIRVDARSASLAGVRWKHAGSMREFPLVRAETLRFGIPVGTWDGHEVAGREASGFGVRRRTADSITLGATTFATTEGAFPLDVEVDYRLERDNLVARLRVRNLGPASITAITFPAIGVAPATDASETLSTTSGPQRLRTLFSDNRIRTHHDPFERLDPEDVRGWGYDDPAFSTKALEYPSGFLLHSAWMHYGAKDFGVGIESRDRTFQSQFALIERRLVRDRESMAANRRTYELSWRWVPHVARGESWESPDIHLRFDGGDWHGIARQHREWLAGWVQRPIVAQKFRDSLGWVSRGVSDFDQIPALARDALDAGIPYLLIYGWYGRGMSGLSYDFVPQASLGGEASLRRNLRAARDLGAYPLAWYNGTTTSEIMPEHREYGRDWVAVNRHGGVVIDGRWTLFDPDRPPSTEDASTLMNYDMATPAGPFNVDNVRRMILDYGFSGFEMDQGAKNFPSYRQSGEPGRPELRYTTGAREVYAAARDIVKTQDPDNVIIGEGYSDFMNQYVDSTWTFEGGQVSLPQSTYSRYSLPWVTMPAGIFEPDERLVNQAFLLNAPLDIFLDLRAHPEFSSRLRRLRQLKQAVQRYLYDWNYSDDEGFTLRTIAGSALQAKSYVAPDGLGLAVVVINSGARTEEGALEIPGAEPDGITVHRLDQPVAMPARGTPVALQLSAYDVNVFVVERLRQ